MLEGKRNELMKPTSEILFYVLLGFMVKTTLISIFFDGIKQGNEIAQVKGNLSCF